ncbi:MAG: hypothetical protein WEF86_11025 [Gemmatimonadota bacterium]
MASYGNSSKRIPRESLRVDATPQPGWMSGSEHLPAVGDQVRCAEGLAEVVKINGKTGDGSRLLELALPDRPRQPFFAAASNVLVAAPAAAK